MLLEAMRDFCVSQGFDKTYVVAFSGGLDSHVLLSLLCVLRQSHPVKIRVVHVNHGLSPNASAWAVFCERLCQAYQVSYREYRLSLQRKPGESLEALAREGRYASLADSLNDGEILLTAHHQDDQAETLLLQLLRGAGPKGLASMPVIKPFGRGYHGRPLLSFSRGALQSYAEAHRLEWVNDESNQDIVFSRNYIRSEVIPQLQQFWPAAAVMLARSASHCAEVNALLEDYGVDDCLKMQGSRANTLSVQKLIQLSPARQRHVLRIWIGRLGSPLPDSRKLASIQRDVLAARWDAMPCIVWGGVALRRYRDDLYLIPRVSQPPLKERIEWDLSMPLMLPGLGQLSAMPVLGCGLRADIARVSVGVRGGGERLQLPNRDGRHSLKQLFQTWGVPPWERASIPLIFWEDKLISVLGYFLDENYAAKAGETGWVITQTTCAE